MVSSGLSIRGRVGFDRSGSAAAKVSAWFPVKTRAVPTDDIAGGVAVLNAAERRDGALLEDGVD